MIEYRVGNALDAPERPVCFPHVVNDVGRFGKGYSGALATRWPEVRTSYLGWFNSQAEFQMGIPPFLFGRCYAVTPEAGVTIVHMLAQKGVGRGRQRLLYAALAQCLLQIGAAPLFVGSTFVMPKIGCGLAGGQWDAVESVIQRTIGGLPVVVYTGVE